MGSYVLTTIFVCFAVASVYCEISGFGAGTPNVDDLPILQGDSFLREKCLRNGVSNDTYEIIMEAKNNVEECVTPLINIQELNREIEIAAPNGDVDVVFDKYCKKIPDFRNCVQNFTTAIDMCLDKSEKATKKITTDVAELLLSFMCYNDADHLALFYAEGGKNCLMDKKEGILQCLNSTMYQYAPLGQLEFKFEENQCKIIANLKRCVVTEMETCRQPTPANMIEALFELIRRNTPCLKFVGRT